MNHYKSALEDLCSSIERQHAEVFSAFTALRVGSRAYSTLKARVSTLSHILGQINDAIEVADAMDNGTYLDDQADDVAEQGDAMRELMRAGWPNPR